MAGKQEENKYIFIMVYFQTAFTFKKNLTSLKISKSSFHVAPSPNIEIIISAFIRSLTWAQWCTPLIPATGRLQQKCHEFGLRSNSRQAWTTLGDLD